MNVKLLSHTQLSEEFRESLNEELDYKYLTNEVTDGQMVALTAIRTCYSHNEPSKIVELEGGKYFKTEAKDGKGGTDADRLIRHIINSGHQSTVEHINFSFSIEGVSRSLLAQLTRHRHFSYSVQSQRYVKFDSDSKSKGFRYVIPEGVTDTEEQIGTFIETMNELQDAYDKLRKLGVPAEDARYILPNAATCNLVLTGNLRSFLDFYSKRSAKGAQIEIRYIAELIKDEIIKVEPWTKSFFITG